MAAIIILIISLCLAGCAIVTVPVKVATKTAGTAIDITTTAVDMAIPDGEVTNTK
ncbi:hypothetical protein [Kordiimonas pumila]|uniref:Uncharacterized protein n=1 Tax=Kordiimonas pumila TaxID=2161677 RepID=A0ABV7D8B4_9PROT|nr:hypothetical protein [Kordiimonas pumila]